MSVQKRKQARAIQQLASKLPLTNLAGLAILYVLATQGFAFGESSGGVTPWIYGLVGAVVGVVVFGMAQKPLHRYENVWKAKVREVGQKFESKLDEEQGGNNKLIDAYELQYLGGHPGWALKDKLEYGTLDIHEKSMVFKNRNHRIKFQLARVRRISLEGDKIVRMKKLAGVVLPKAKLPKQPVLAKLVGAIQKRQRYILVDYLDDLGQKNMVVFYPVAGNPLLAKSVKAAIDEQLKKIPKDKREKATSQTTALQQVSDEAIAAAEAASRRVTQGSGPLSGNTGSLQASVPAAGAGELRYQVVLESAGSTPEDHAAVAAQMATLFGIPEDRAMGALARVPFVAKRNLSAQQADKLVAALTATGAQARSEAMSPAPSA